MTIDWSKGTALHRLYGHFVFCMEARKQKKAEHFIDRICEDVKCTGEKVTWNNHVEQLKIERSYI